MHSLRIILSLAMLFVCHRAHALTLTPNYNNTGFHHQQHQLERRRHHHRSGRFSGRGTWFEPGEGACGGARADRGSMIVALNQEQYGDTDAVSRYCGRRIRITYAGKTVHATVQDACPGCPFGALDMSPAVFDKLAAASVGVIQMSWRFTDGDSVAAKHATEDPEEEDEAQDREARGHSKHSASKNNVCSGSKSHHHKEKHCKTRKHHKHLHHNWGRQLADEQDSFGAGASDDIDDRGVDVTTHGLGDVEER